MTLKSHQNGNIVDAGISIISCLFDLNYFCMLKYLTPQFCVKTTRDFISSMGVKFYVLDCKRSNLILFDNCLTKVTVLCSEISFISDNKNAFVNSIILNKKVLTTHCSVSPNFCKSIHEIIPHCSMC